MDNHAASMICFRPHFWVPSQTFRPYLRMCIVTSYPAHDLNLDDLMARILIDQGSDIPQEKCPVKS
jgi:hypothetical protein